MAIVIGSYQSRMMDHVIVASFAIRLLMRSVKKSLTLPEDATVGDLKKVVGRRSGSELFLMNQQQVVGIIGLHEVIARQLSDGLLCGRWRRMRFQLRWVEILNRLLSIAK